MKRGFTLIELLVVIAIIGILTGIIVPNLTEARKSGRDAKRIADIKSLQLAIGLYYSDNQKYPHTALATALVPTYLSSIPKDPSTGNDYPYVPLAQGTGLPNCNAAATPAVLYHLGAALETNHPILNEDTTIFQTVTTGGATINSVSYARCSGISVANFHSESASCTQQAAAGSGLERCFDVTIQ